MSQKMPGESADGAMPNWREAQNYTSLLKLDRPGWAWEWLRRNPGYAAQTMGCSSLPCLVSSPETKAGLSIFPASDNVAGWGLLFPGEIRPPDQRCQSLLASGLECVGRCRRCVSGFSSRYRRVRRGAIRGCGNAAAA